MKPSKIRLSIDLTHEEKAHLYELQRKGRQSTIAEVFRKATALYELYLDHAANGGKITLTSKDGENETLRIL